MPDDIEKPIKVDPSVSIAMILAAIRQLILIGGGAVTLGTMVKNHNFPGLVAWFQSNDAAVMAVALGTIATFVYGQWHVFWGKITSIVAARAAPNSVAVVQRSRFTRLVYAIFGKR